MSHNNGRFDAPLRGRDDGLAPFAPMGHARSAQRNDVARLIGALRQHLLLVALTTATVVGATVYLIMRQERQYVAAATVRLADARRQLTSGIEQREEAPERATSLLLSQIQALRSRSLIGRVVDGVGYRLRLPPDVLASGIVTDVDVDSSARPDTLRLRFRAEEVTARSRAGSARAAYGRPLSLGGVTFTVIERPDYERAEGIVTTREEAVDDLLAALDVKPRASTNVVDVTYRSTSPATAQQVVNAVVESFRRQSANAAQQQSRLRRRFLEGQLRRIDSTQTLARAELRNFIRRTQSYRSADRLTAQQRDVMELEMMRERVRGERDMYIPLLSSSAESDGTAWVDGVRSVIGAVTGGEDPAIAPLLERLATYQAARDSLTTGTWRRSATDPDVQQLDELIAGSRRQLSAAIGGRVEAYDTRIASIEEQRSRRATSLAAVADLQTEEDRLQQRVATIERTEMILRDEAQKARAAEAVEIGEVEIVDLASLPYAPSSNLAPVKLGLGLILGLGLGGGLAMLREWGNTTIRNREELEELLQMPSLGSIPSLARTAMLSGGAGRILGDARRRLRWGDAPLYPMPRQARAGELAALDARASQQAEAYRVLSTNLLSVPDEVRPASFVVTSAGVSEGKTTVAANLAVTLARAGRRVLLIDCDLRRARLHHVFGVPRAPGLVQALEDITSVDGGGGLIVGPSAIHLTSTPGLDLMPRGSGDVDEHMLVSGNALPQLLRELQQQYDVVVLDAPPVLAMAYTLQLAAVADGVLFVARAGKTQRAAIRETVRRLRHAHARMAGCVLTDADPEQAFHQYYAAYSTTYADA